jgi:diguanylate cyclase (GGDEF)-like protein
VSRAQTLVLALLVLHLLLGGLSLAIARGEHKSSALNWWGWGLLLYSAGLVVTLPLGLLPRTVTQTLGNAMITVAPILCGVAVLKHTRWRIFWRLIWGLAALTVALLAWNNFVGPTQAIFNLVLPTPLAVVMFVLGAYAIAREGPRESRSANYFLAGVMLAAVVLWLLRIVGMVNLMGTTNDVARIDAVISFFAIAQMVTGVGATLALFWIDVRIMQAELSRVAHTDALTGLPNRRAVLARFEEEASRAARHGEKFGFAVFDLDHFKRVNDTLGHAVGDEVLKATAAALASAKRNEDLLARLGGEEFLVLFASQHSGEGAMEGAERLREAVSRIDTRFGGKPLRITVSGGVALYPDDGSAFDSLYIVADRRLYAAKEAGRDRIVGKD